MKGSSAFRHTIFMKPNNDARKYRAFRHKIVIEMKNRAMQQRAVRYATSQNEYEYFVPKGTTACDGGLIFL